MVAKQLNRFPTPAILPELVTAAKGTAHGMRMRRQEVQDHGEYAGASDLKSRAGEPAGGEPAARQSRTGFTGGAVGRSVFAKGHRQRGEPPAGVAMTLFWHQCGPLLRYQNGFLDIEDLNPEMKTRWRMSRAEMLKLGWRCMVAACRR
jgi:hypothetical protein